MAYAEAVAHGLPVIGTNAGAIPDTVPPEPACWSPPAMFRPWRRRCARHRDDPICGGASPSAARAAAPQLPTWRQSAEDLCARIGDADMSGFSAEWLALREPYDLRARNPAVLDAVAAFLKPRPSVRVVDLACGTGSTLRALSPHLPPGRTGRWSITTSTC